MTVAPRPGPGAWEAQTLGLAVLIYGAWALLLWRWEDVPAPIAVAALAWLLAWHGSLQHEVIHGHPTPWRALNHAIAWPPIALWLPFERYRQAHLRHHREPWITDPIEDPESAYLTAAAWRRTGAFGRALWRFNLTLSGRLLLGPFLTLATIWSREWRKVRTGTARDRRIWALHGAGVALVLAWVAACGVPLWLYFIGGVIPSIALTRLRAFAEHRFADAPEGRTAIVEDTPVFGLLFLHNNLHVVHHRWPNVPWYRLPALYRAHRRHLVERNGGLVYRGYREIARRFLFSPHDVPVHPHHGAAPLEAPSAAPDAVPTARLSGGAAAS